MVTASQPAKRKITDPMEVWEAYWQASAESLVYEVQWSSQSAERLARKHRTSVQVIEASRQMDRSAVDVLAARQRKKEITRLLVEHYLSVPLNLAIEKARQTGEDFGEYFAVATETLRDAIPRWQLGKAPFANFANVRIKWCFFDEIHAGRWSQSVELTDEFCAPLPEDTEEKAGQVWRSVNRLPVDHAEIVRRSFGLGQSAEEIGSAMQRSREWVNQERDAAVASLRVMFGENVG